MSAYLSFELNRLTYALPATAVREIFPLPELVPIAEAPGDIIGLLNLRGRILPVMHLARRLGQTLPLCRPNDRIVVVAWQGLTLGIVVQVVRDVIEIAASDIATEPDYGRIGNTYTAFVGGVVQAEEHLTIILNLDTLIRDAGDVAALAELDFEAVGEELAVPTDFYSRYFPEASGAQRQLLHDRALALQAPFAGATEDDSRFLLAAFRLGGELFGFDVRYVREFVRLPATTPIPCCPPHILGNANLRGDILTLVDIRTALNLPAPDRAEFTQAIAIEVDDIVAGIATGEVFDVLSLPVEAIQSAPATGRAHLMGTTAYGDRTLGIIDLPDLLARGGLTVNEAAT